MAAADQSGAIPEHFQSLIEQVQEREAKNYYERWQRHYFGHRDEFFASVNRLEKVQMTLTRNMQMNPQAYPEKLKEYVRTVVLPLLASARQAEEGIKKDESDINTWVEVKNRETFGYVLPAGEAKLKEVMKTTYPTEERGEELVSRIRGKEKEMEEVMKNADRCFADCQDDLHASCGFRGNGNGRGAGRTIPRLLCSVQGGVQSRHCSGKHVFQLPGDAEQLFERLQ